MKKLLLFSAAFCFAACGSSASSSVLTTLTDVTASTKCPAGGVKISAGLDKNNNLTLDADEVTQTSEICNGAAGTGTAGATGATGANGSNGSTGATGDAGEAGFTTLVKTTIEGSGAACAMGGVKVELGLDNGDGSGVARNGTLEAGEIDETRYVCNGSTPYYPGSVTAPGGAAGTSRISTNGGNGTTGSGGQANEISVYMTRGSLGGNVKVFKTGSVDAGFEAPATNAFFAGVRPMVVASDFVLKNYSDFNQGLASGDPFFQANYSRVFSSDAGEVTSLSIAAGATLTVQYGQLEFSGDIANAGTLTTEHNNRNANSLQISAGAFVGTAGSSIKLIGLEDGGSGGQLSISANRDVVSLGTIATNGVSGGNGGRIELNSNSNPVVLGGSINASGGSNDAGIGGNAGEVSFGGSGVFSTATISASGGDGLSRGGNGNSITLSSHFGDTRNTGTLTSTGGACTGAACTGGNGSQIRLSTQSGELASNARLDVSGGRAEGQAGNGGSIQFNNEEQNDNNFSFTTGSVRVSGDLLAVGGDGATGGQGGSVSIELRPERRAHGQEIELLGYAELTANGGQSTGGTNSTSGGQAGRIALKTNRSQLQGSVDAPSGAIVNYTKLIAHGGDGYYAGSGGNIELRTQNWFAFGVSAERVINYGDLETGSGSTSSDSQGVPGGGNIRLRGVNGVENHGSLKANGGNAGGYSGGGWGGDIELYSVDGRVDNIGTVTSNGGTGNQSAGYGGWVSLRGKSVNTTGAITANGGNATVFGGRGGSIEIQSLSTHEATSTSPISVAGGTGTTPGELGQVLIEGIRQ